MKFNSPKLIFLSFLIITSFFQNIWGRTIEVDKTKLVFDDGDTFFYDGMPVRFLGVDTPEIKHESLGMFENQYLGQEASEFTRRELIKAKSITIITNKKDRYNRALGHILVDGELLAVKILKAGLGYETISHYGSSGFKEFEDTIQNTWKQLPRPNFENPIYWRSRNRKKVLK
ncbi:thermonuclease family protein [bacterium]